MWKVEGIDCLAMYCVKDVHVNDVITFDHSAEIEVIFLSLCLNTMFTSAVSRDK